jgi:hypothetical protein
MPRQRHVPLSIYEREELDRRKRDYEEKTGDTGDWGKFLKTVSLAGLAALGVYSVAPAARRGPTVWQVKCSRCAVMFPVRVPNPPPWRLADLSCPKCDSGLVIDFARQAPDVANGNEGSGGGSLDLYCHYCEQPIEASSSKISPRGVEYMECARCGRAARLRSH